MRALGLASIAGALAVCLPCLILPVLAAAGIGGMAAALGAWVGLAIAIPVGLMALTGMLLTIRMVRRRSCGIPQ